MPKPLFNQPIFSGTQKRALSLSLMIAAGLYLVLIFVTGKEAVLAAVARLSGPGWLLILGCSLANYGLRFIRWHYYLRVLGHCLPNGRHLLYYMSGFALTTTPGKAGETIRSLYLKPHGVKYTHSLAAFFCERFLDVITITMLALLPLFVFADYTKFVVMMALALVALLPVLRSQWLIKRMDQHAKLQPVTRWKKALGHIANLLTAARDLLEYKRLYLGMMIGLIAWGIQGLAFYFILHSLGLETSLFIALGIYAISLLAGAASFIPGGVGATEVVMGLLLISVGADTPVAVAVPLISRLSTLWFAVLLGLLATGYLGWKGASVTNDTQIDSPQGTQRNNLNRQDAKDAKKRFCDGV